MDILDETKLIYYLCKLILYIRTSKLFSFCRAPVTNIYGNKYKQLFQPFTLKHILTMKTYLKFLSLSVSQSFILRLHLMHDGSASLHLETKMDKDIVMVRITLVYILITNMKTDVTNCLLSI